MNCATEAAHGVSHFATEHKRHKGLEGAATDPAGNLVIRILTLREA